MIFWIGGKSLVTSSIIVSFSAQADMNPIFELDLRLKLASQCLDHSYELLRPMSVLPPVESCKYAILLDLTTQDIETLL